MERREEQTLHCIYLKKHDSETKQICWWYFISCCSIHHKCTEECSTSIYQFWRHLLQSKRTESTTSFSHAYFTLVIQCFSWDNRSEQTLWREIFFRNLLLMASANAAEIGVLGTNESGETPAWRQYLQVNLSIDRICGKNENQTNELCFNLRQTVLALNSHWQPTIRKLFQSVWL